jgi:hypothetical protein
MSDSFRKQRPNKLEEDGTSSDFAANQDNLSVPNNLRASAKPIKGTPRKPKQPVQLDQSFRQGQINALQVERTRSIKIRNAEGKEATPEALIEASHSTFENIIDYARNKSTTL